MRFQTVFHAPMLDSGFIFLVVLAASLRNIHQGFGVTNSSSILTFHLSRIHLSRRILTHIIYARINRYHNYAHLPISVHHIQYTHIWMDAQVLHIP